MSKEGLVSESVRPGPNLIPHLLDEVFKGLKISLNGGFWSFYVSPEGITEKDNTIQNHSFTPMVSIHLRYRFHQFVQSTHCILSPFYFGPQNVQKEGPGLIR